MPLRLLAAAGLVAGTLALLFWRAGETHPERAAGPEPAPPAAGRPTAIEALLAGDAPAVRAEAPAPDATGQPRAADARPEAAAPDEVLLDVRDAATGEPLPDVEVVRAHRSRVHPGNRPSPLARGDSPLALPVEALEALRDPGPWGRCFVRAPGYAWREVQLDLRGDRVDVELERGGTVLVDVRGLGQAQELKLILTTDDGSLRSEVPLSADRRVRIEDWPAGRAFARVQRGRDLADPKRFGSDAGMLAAGAALELRIDLDPEASRPISSFELGLDVTVPAAWAFEELRVRCRLETSPSGADGVVEASARPLEPAAEGAPQRFRFDFGPQPAGTWVATFTPTTHRVVLPLEAPGRHAIELPEPAQVTVVTIDPQTGAAVGGAWVLWAADFDGPSSGHFLFDAQPLEQPGHFGFRAPAGRIELDVEHEDYGSTTPSFELVPGAQTLTVELPGKTPHVPRR